MTAETNKEAVRRIIAALPSADLSVLDEVCAPDVAQLWG